MCYSALFPFCFLFQLENTSGNTNATGVPATKMEAPSASIQQTLIEPPTKKRKEVVPKSKVWEFFERIKDDSGVVIKGKCLYYEVFSYNARYGFLVKKCHVV